MQLSVIFLANDIVIGLHRFLAILVMIDTLSPITCNDSLSQNLYRFYSHLTLTGTLFDSLKEFDWILGTTVLCT
jgi:hypothetical protein